MFIDVAYFFICFVIEWTIRRICKVKSYPRFLIALNGYFQLVLLKSQQRKRKTVWFFLTPLIVKMLLQ